MKILGLACGRKMGNSEVLLREALEAAAAVSNAEMELIRLSDLNIQPCTGCIACLIDIVKGGDGHCFKHKDDFAFIENKFYECDAFLVAAPIYIWSGPGSLKVLCDRFGPSHDRAFAACSREMNQGQSHYDERIYKERAGGFIAVGGAPHNDWTTMAIPSMYQLTMPMNVNIVDHMTVLRAGNSGQIVFREKAIERAAQLGRNVTQAMLQPPEARKWMGDGPGTCPVCHCDLMVLGKTTNVLCAVCGINGKLTIDGDRVNVVFSPEEQAKSRLYLEGKRIHFYEIQEVTGEFFSMKDELPARLKKYQASKIPVTKPPREHDEARLVDVVMK